MTITSNYFIKTAHKYCYIYIGEIVETQKSTVDDGSQVFVPKFYVPVVVCLQQSHFAAIVAVLAIVAFTSLTTTLLCVICSKRT